jgi:hypothetical protein
MRSSLGVLGMAFFCSCLTACGVSTDGDADLELSAQSEEYTYQLSENGCDTGKHTFRSKSAYCDGLRNSDLNRGCASYLRRMTFTNAGCPGSF